VFLLDEVDKMSTDFRGDPAAALLEVLDPEQNTTFNDHYLDLDYDLSDVMFITTANTLRGIPVPLQDRMEIIQLSGYTEFEKLNIAREVPRAAAAQGVRASRTCRSTVTEGAIRTIIHHYTRESGVRLEREIASVCRKVARQVVKRARGEPIEITRRRPEVPRRAQVPHGQARGARRDRPRERASRSRRRRRPAPDEAAVCPARASCSITGLLEKGMEESGAGGDELRALALERMGSTDFYQKVDVHVHFPEACRRTGPARA
jgi:ATP-dependent Lon protease